MKFTDLEEVGPRRKPGRGRHSRAFETVACPNSECGAVKLRRIESRPGSISGSKNMRTRLYECHACGQRCVTEECIVLKAWKERWLPHHYAPE